MNDFVTFVVALGALFVALALIASWQLRVLNVPLRVKLVLPVLMVAAAIYTPYQVSALMGRPVNVEIADLPARFELIAFYALDKEERVDIWIGEGDTRPRVYEVPLTEPLKKALREAKERLQAGEAVYVEKPKRLATATGANPYGDRPCPTCAGDYTLKVGSRAMPNKE